MSFGRPEPEAPRTRRGVVELAALLLGPPLAWAAHLGVVYFAVTMDCYQAWSGAGWGVLIATVLLAAVPAWCAWTGLRRWREQRGDARGRELDPLEPRPFIHLLAIAGGVLFGVTIILTGTTPLFTGTC